MLPPFVLVCERMTFIVDDGDIYNELGYIGYIHLTIIYFKIIKGSI
jgi:hypothetical protein